MCKNLTRVFVYGTLKTNEPNAHIMRDTNGVQRFIRNGKTNRLFPLIVSSKYNIPFLLMDPGRGYHIHGEVYEIDKEKLRILDELEAYPTLYSRSEEIITMDNGATTLAWIYMLPRWRPDIHELSTPLLECYSSKGPHGREYISSENVKSEEDLWS